MHIQIVAGNDQSDAPKQLRQLKELADCLGETTKTVHAEAYSAIGLVEILEVCGVSEREKFWCWIAARNRSRRCWNGSRRLTK